MPILPEKDKGLFVDKLARFERKILYEAPVFLQRGEYSIGKIGGFTYINENFFSKNVKCIGRYCSIAPNVILGHYSHPTNTISHHNVFYGVGRWMDEWHSYKNSVLDVRDLVQKTGPIEIGNDVWIGVNSIIMNGVKIGDGAICGAMSVVTHDVPPYAVVAGNPAKIIRYRYEKDIIARLLKLAWWNYPPEILSDLDLTDVRECIKNIQVRIDRGLQPYCVELKEYIQ